MSNITSFIHFAVGLSFSKLWHDTLRLFLNMYMPNCNRDLFGSYIGINAAGVLVGGVCAGLLTDSLTPKITFPISILTLGILSTLLMALFEFPALEGLFGNGLSIVLLGLIGAIGFCLVYKIVKKESIAKIFERLTSCFNRKIVSKQPMFYIGLAIAALVTTLLAYTLKFNTLITSLLSIKHLLIFVRGFFIALGMNSAYVAVGNLYRGNPFLATASNYLYIVLFGSLAVVPLLFGYLPTKPMFILFTGSMYLLAWLLTKHIPETKSSEINVVRYFQAWVTLLSRREFIAVCFVSMICIGGFYNLYYIFTDAQMNGNFPGNLSLLQVIGRFCTFGILAAIYLFNVSALKTSQSNCAQYMSAGIGVVAASAFVVLLVHLGLPGKDLSLVAEIAFWLTCFCTGFCQPAAKYSIIAMSQRIGPNITGSAQSFVTLVNSAIEQQGSQLIFKSKYPLGGRVYLVILIIFCSLLALYLFNKRKSINDYLKIDKK